MNYLCPHCNASLRWRVLKARLLSLKESHYVCSHCGGALRQNPWPTAYNFAVFWLLFPGVRCIRLMLANRPAPDWLWVLIAGLALVGAFGYRWTMGKVPKTFRRFDRASET